MKRSLGNTLAAVAILGAAACGAQSSAGGPAAAAPTSEPAAQPAGGAEPATVSVYNGVYTAAQATRGNQIQQRECSSCHSTGDWAQGRLLSGWTNQPAYALVEHLRQTMPMDSPGRLSLQQYTDIFAFMLQLNNVPPGSDELGANQEALSRVTIEYRR